jgi:hypothetical protein
VSRNIGCASGSQPLDDEGVQVDDPARALFREEELCKDDEVSLSFEDFCKGKSSARCVWQLECTRSDIE